LVDDDSPTIFFEESSIVESIGLFVGVNVGLWEGEEFTLPKVEEETGLFVSIVGVGFATEGAQSFGNGDPLM
jgi:hypothetical protein